MLVVFTSESNNVDEIPHVVHMLKSNLCTIHLRKPKWTRSEYHQYLEAIPSEFHSQIMIHQHHDLGKEFNVKGIHFTETDRLNSGPSSLTHLIQSDWKISTSFHSLKQLAENAYDWDYQFLSPVFDSISKHNYAGKKFDVGHINKHVIALGGINKNNIQKCALLGYKGIAVLGAIWSQSNPINSFNQIVTAYQQHQW